jgi:aromatic-amino-acid transaminase
VRIALAMADAAGIKRVLMGVPSWPNHAQILRDVGLELVSFQHATSGGDADMDALKAALASAGEGDAVLLHGCCHNPTGIDYTPADWDEIAGLLANSPVLPIVDLAYQGLGHGMEEDAAGMRTLLAAVPEALVAYSCDKNFGLYRDRVGAFYAMVREGGDLNAAMSNGHTLARATWSMPPDHGAAAVRIILEDAAFTAQWLDELDQMRERIRQVRARLAAAGKVGSVDLAPIEHQNGLFATLALTKEQIHALRADHAVYMAGSGRINIAGLTMDNIETFIDALAAVGD